MNLHRFALVPLTLVPALATACSAAAPAPGENPSPRPVRQHRCRPEGLQLSTRPPFTFAAEAAEVTSASLSVTNGVLTFIPSSGMVTLLFPGDTVAEHTVVQAIPSVVWNAPDPFGAYTITLASLSMLDISTDMQPSAIHVHADLTGTISLTSPNLLQPNISIHLENVAVDALIGLAGTAPSSVPATPSNSGFYLKTLDDVVTFDVMNGCSLGPACSTLLTLFLPEGHNILQSAGINALGPVISGSEPALGLFQFLEYQAKVEDPTILPAGCLPGRPLSPIRPSRTAWPGCRAFPLAPARSDVTDPVRES